MAQCTYNTCIYTYIYKFLSLFGNKSIPKSHPSTIINNQHVVSINFMLFIYSCTKNIIIIINYYYYYYYQSNIHTTLKGKNLRIDIPVKF